MGAFLSNTRGHNSLRSPQLEKKEAVDDTELFLGLTVLPGQRWQLWRAGGGVARRGPPRRGSRSAAHQCAIYAEHPSRQTDWPLLIGLPSSPASNKQPQPRRAALHPRQHR